MNNDMSHANTKILIYKQKDSWNLNSYFSMLYRFLKIRRPWLYCILMNESWQWWENTYCSSLIILLSMITKVTVCLFSSSSWFNRKTRGNRKRYTIILLCTIIYQIGKNNRESYLTEKILKMTKLDWNIWYKLLER